jgi:phosphoribosyl-ATP pyrophosphohydrolase/phosphoribosyl-AMP cyclohydrolase/histidinol dehydrogenase
VHGLQHLQAILQARLVSAPEGSYTKRLFTDKDLLQKKLVEEALELAEAEDHDDVAGEAADLMYFLMVRCVAAGVSLKDVEKKLDYRSLKVTRRPGNAKEWRTQAAAVLLGTGSARLAGAGGAMPPAPPS